VNEIPVAAKSVIHGRAAVGSLRGFDCGGHCNVEELVAHGHTIGPIGRRENPLILGISLSLSERMNGQSFTGMR
jgi:hypothetical protein